MLSVQYAAPPLQFYLVPINLSECFIIRNVGGQYGTACRPMKLNFRQNVRVYSDLYTDLKSLLFLLKAENKQLFIICPHVLVMFHADLGPTDPYITTRLPPSLVEVAILLAFYVVVY